MTDGGWLVLIAWIAGLLTGFGICIGSIWIWIPAVLLTAASVFYYRFLLRPIETGEY